MDVGSGTPTTPAFAEDAKRVLKDLRSSLSALVESVGADASFPQEMSRRFGLDKSLTWKVARVIGGDDTLSAATHMPGRAGLLTFVDALEHAGAPHERAGSVRDAIDRFESFITTHSGDRSTLEIMLGGVSERLSPKRIEFFRKLAFQGNSAIWGVQAKTQVSLHFIAPNPTDPDKLDVGIVCGLIDFRRLRPDALWAVASRFHLIDDGTLDAFKKVVPIDPALGPRDTPLLRQFCSQPLAELREVPAGPGIRYEFTEGPVGITAAATCILGWLDRGDVSRYRSETDNYGEHIVNLNTPVETLVHDVYIHRSLGFAIPPEVHVYSQMPGGPVYPRDGRKKGVMALPEETIDLGSPPDCTIAALPRCTQMVEFAARNLGWALSDFHGFRYRLKYPPLPALALFRYRLPERP
jgi:hypothetical protein